MREAAAGLSPAEQAIMGVNETIIEVQADRLTQPWFAFFLHHDPAVELRKIRVPVLALFGEKDLQVTPDQNASVMAAALSDAGVVSRVQVLKDLNHLFQTAGLGTPAEYGTLTETFAPAALEVMTSWLEATLR